MRADTLADVSAGAQTPIIRGRLRAWVAPGVDLEREIAGDGDPEHLLTRPDCWIVKLQRKVVVGRITTAAGTLYVKRYNVFAWSEAAETVWRGSPARGAWRGAQRLAARGFAVPDTVAAIDVRRLGLVVRSYFITREVPGALTADARWREILAEPDPARRRVARRALARVLGELFRRLHAAGVYHNDLKDVNVLIAGPAEAPRCVLLDLERVRVLRRVGRRRRLKNVVQLARTLGRHASGADRARFLRAYLGADASAAERRWWATEVARRAVRIDRRHPAPPPSSGPTVSCTIVCQNEEENIAPCLESVAWCDEIVVIDGGSTDRTVEIARRFTDRVIFNPWPGYRAQKQFALDCATGDWVFNIDADERATPELAAEIRTRLARVPPDVDGFAAPRLVCYLGRWWYRGGWYPRRVLRVVRRARTRWVGSPGTELEFAL